MNEIALVGLGNVLMGDDGLGPHVLRAYESAYEPDPGVAVLDLGTPGLDLAPHLMEAWAAIVVDTVKAGGEPGEVRLYRRDDILRRPPPSRVTPHQPGLQETLLTLHLLGCGPGDVLLVGVVPEEVELGLGLSPALEAAVPRALEAVVAELTRLGRPPRRRREPVDVDAWWAERASEHFPLPARPVAVGA